MLLLYESNTDVDYSELWIYIEPMCRIVGGRYARIVKRTPVSGVEGLGRNLMDVFRLRRRLVDDYGSYVSSFIRIKDERIEEEVLSSLGDGLLWPDPLIQLNPSFEAGKIIDHAEPRGGSSLASGSSPTPVPRRGTTGAENGSERVPWWRREDVRIPIAGLV